MPQASAKEGKWSGRRDLNPRLRPWQGRTLPLSYSRSGGLVIISNAHPSGNVTCVPENAQEFENPVLLEVLAFSPSYFADTVSWVASVFAELVPTRMSNTPGSTTRRISSFQSAKLSGVRLKVTVVFSPGAR